MERKETGLARVVWTLVGAVVGAVISFGATWGHDVLKEGRERNLRISDTVAIVRSRLANDVYFTRTTRESLPEQPNASRLSEVLFYPDQPLTADAELGILHIDILAGLDQYNRVVRQAQRCRQALFLPNESSAAVPAGVDASGKMTVYKTCLDMVVRVGEKLIEKIDQQYPDVPRLTSSSPVLK